MRKCLNGQCRAGDEQKLGCEALYLRRGVVNERDKRRGDGDEHANADVQHDGKEQKLIIRALCFFNFTRAELLADDNGNGVAHGEHDDAEEVPYCAGNVRGGDDGQTARGVALVDHRGADTPEELVKHERRAGEEDLFHDGTGQIQAFI